jgi:hypothetical protein
MIEAELRGKVPSELQDVEDLLTSAVFGLLQYVPPSIFWPTVLTRAESCKGKLFVERCKELGAHIPNYEKVDVHFWPVHQRFGEPDLLLVFSGGNQLPLCFIIEAKLWANKSGREQQDQLNRYLAALKDSRWLVRIIGFHGPVELPGLIYLTPRAAWLELYDSVRNAPDSLATESSLFLLQWQDILEVARQVFPQADEPQRTMLSRIADFLEHRGLAYFRGFSYLPLEDFTAMEACFYSPTKVGFSGFTEMPLERALLAELSFYTSKRVSIFRGFTEEPFESVTTMDTLFYGGNQ